MNDIDRIREALKKLKFTDKESAIYIALLKLGNAPASILALKTDMPRPTAKFTCEQLAKRNIIESIQKGNTTIYSIDSPEKLLYILDQKEEELEEQRDEINRLMSTLKTLKNPHSVLPKVQYYEGIDAVAEAFIRTADSIEQGSELLSFTKTVDEHSDLAPEILAKIRSASTAQIQNRVNRNIKARVISSYSAGTKKLHSKDKESLRETRYIDAKYAQFDFGEILIYQNTTFAVTIEDNICFAVKIENQTLAGMYRTLFEISWDHSSDDYDKID